jgi:hypothetical protein
MASLVREIRHLDWRGWELQRWKARATLARVTPQGPIGWGGTLDSHHRDLQGRSPGLGRWRGSLEKVTGSSPRVDALERYPGARVQGRAPGSMRWDGAAATSATFRQSAFGCASDGKVTGGRGGGLSFLAPKSFVGKHFTGQLQLCAFSVAKRGRWVYEGSELKAFRTRTKYFSINFIVRRVGSGVSIVLLPGGWVLATAYESIKSGSDTCSW